MHAEKEDEGCGINQSSSLVIPGMPLIGQNHNFFLHNLLGTQDADTIPIVVFSLNSLATGGGCGPVIPGWHMDPTEPGGELIVATPFAAKVYGTPWNGVGSMFITIPIPNGDAFLGATFIAQGALVDPTPPPGGTEISLTSALELTIGTLP